MYLNAYKTSGLFSSNENKFNIYQNKMNSVQYYCIYFLIIPCISYNVDDNLKSPSLSDKFIFHLSSFNYHPHLYTFLFNFLVT